MKISHEIPRAEEYVHLRSITGLSIKTIESAKIALPNSVFAVTIRDNSNGTLIGMGRIVGDGACMLQITDIAVNPAYQGQGFGKKIIAELIDFIEKKTATRCLHQLDCGLAC